MTNQEILEKAKQKAEQNGWTCNFNMKDVQRYSGGNLVLYYWLNGLIFSRDFAKALWGDSDDDRIVIVGETDWRKWPLPWQYHLQQMVISPDPIKYLGENI